MTPEHSASSAEAAQSAETVAFDRLRQDAHAQMKQEIEARIARNPEPTDEEKAIGTYIEGLEPQVRSAVIEMHKKGYQTSSSSFNAGDDDWRVTGIDNPLRAYGPQHRRGQVVDFVPPYPVSAETEAKLSEIGAEVITYPGYEGMARIGFVPTVPDLEVIQNTWDMIASMLPDRGAPAPSIDPGVVAVRFSTNAGDVGVSKESLAAAPFTVPLGETPRNKYK